MKVWLVRAGKFGQQEHIALEHGVAAIGFDEVPSLAGRHTREHIAEAVAAGYPGESEKARINFTGQLHAFVNRMEVGDIIALPRKSNSTIALGKVTGDYQYASDLGDVHHTRPVTWIRTDVPRADIGQDLLYSLGAFMTICRIRRNDAEARFAQIIEGKRDPALTGTLQLDKLKGGTAAAGGDEDVDDDVSADATVLTDVAELAHGQIVDVIRAKYAGHELSRLVEAILKAEGYFTQLAPAGPDGGVDILAGRGALGFDAPRMCVQVKSSDTPADVSILRALQGSMRNFGAEHGLLVCWGGYTKPTVDEASRSYFSVRLWDAGDIVDGLLENYGELPEELRTELPLRRIWIRVLEE